MRTRAEDIQTHKNTASRDSLTIAPPPTRRSRYRYTSDNAVLPATGSEVQNNRSSPHRENQTPAQIPTSRSDWPTRGEDVSDSKSGLNEHERDPTDFQSQLSFSERIYHQLSNENLKSLVIMKYGFSKRNPYCIDKNTFSGTTRSLSEN